MKKITKNRLLRACALLIMFVGLIYSSVLAVKFKDQAYLPLTTVTPVALYGIYLFFREEINSLKHTKSPP
jgi:hypothetical protein